MKLKHFNLSVGTQIFRCFSDDARVRILSLLHHKEEMCVSDIEMILSFTQTKTSRHLIYLKNAGIVGSRKLDQWALYSLKDEVKDIAGIIFQYLSKDPELMNDLETYEILYRSGDLAICKLQGRKWMNN